MLTSSRCGPLFLRQSNSYCIRAEVCIWPIADLCTFIERRGLFNLGLIVCVSKQTHTVATELGNAAETRPIRAEGGGIDDAITSNLDTAIPM